MFIDFFKQLSKGIEQPIIEIGVVITSCLDELSRVRNIQSLQKSFR